MLHFLAVKAAQIRDLINTGQYLAAYDAAMTEVRDGSDDAATRYLAILALKRSGATLQALNRLHAFGLDSGSQGDLPTDLAESISALGPGLAKDMALRSGGESKRVWAEQSAKGYEASFQKYPSAYLAANAATMWTLFGDETRAAVAASSALQALVPLDQREGEWRYWEAASEAEAALVLGQETRVTEAIGLAASLSEDRYSIRATTTRQLKLLCGLLGIETTVLDPLSNPGVVHYCGHRIAAPGEPGRFPAESEASVADRLRAEFDQRDVGFGFGSLAAGADILAAEALLEKGAELHVTLPFSRQEFVGASVASAGANWVQRFERCLADADSVTTATSGEFLDDPVLFDFCARIAMGDALIRGRDIDSAVHQVAVWDGVPTAGAAGTALDVANWQAAGRETTVVGVERSGPHIPSKSEPRREVRGLIFGDFAGFSTLSDAQVLVFQEEVMGGLARAIAPFRRHVLSSNTWGDGLYMVLDGVSAAAECALAIQEEIVQMDFGAMGLGSLGNMRVAAHAAPVFEGRDPISGDRSFFGADVTRAARIEPATPEGEIYVTHPFASLAVLAGGRSFETQYVGTIPTAKGYGDLPLFALHRLQD